MNKIVDKEANMVAMRKQFLKDNQEKHEADNYEFRRRDKDDKVTSIDGIIEQPKEKRLKKKMILLFIYLFIFALNMFILKVDVKLLGLGII